MKSKAEEKLITSRIRLQARSPFFSYLSFFLKFKEVPKMIDGNFTMGVSADGTLIYYAPFVESLSEEELTGVLCHEILHLVFLHLTRRGAREPIKFNVACDVVINAMLLQNGFSLPKGVILPKDDTWEIPKQWVMAEFIKRSAGKGGFLGSPNTKKKLSSKIEDCSKKTAEEVYDLLPDIPQGLKNSMRGNGTSKGDGGVGGWDKHDESSDSSKEGEGKKKEGEEKEGKENGGKVFGEAEKNELEEKWKSRIEEAYIHSKQRGNSPLGLDRHISELNKSQLNWKSLLQKYVLALLPHNHTWMRRNKKSMALESYLPSVEKSEKIEVFVGIDTSGSIDQGDLTAFIGEIVGMAQAYKEKLTIRVMCHDSEVHTNDEVKNGKIEDIKKITIKGGGGTSHKPLFRKIKKEYPKAKVLICFTDGYSDINSIRFKDYDFEKLFIISKQGSDESISEDKGDCTVLKIK